MCKKNIILGYKVHKSVLFGMWDFLIRQKTQYIFFYTFKKHIRVLVSCF